MSLDERDEKLDIYRGLAIIYVIFIHCIYWPGIINHPTFSLIRSYLLLEMPILFFISGVSNSIKRNNNIVKYIINKVKKIIIPYWIYSIISIIVIKISIIYLNGQDKLNIWKWLIAKESWSTLPFITWHLWFVSIYLLTILVFPIFIFIYEKLDQSYKIFPLLTCIIILYVLDKRVLNSSLINYLRYLVFYTFWMYIGIFYNDFSKYKYRITEVESYYKIAALTSYLITYILILKINYSNDMQINKFPPNLAFLFMNLGHFFILCIVKNYIIDNIKKVKIIFNTINLFSRYSYTIYLYQPYGFLIARKILYELKINNIILTTPIWQFTGIFIYFIVNILCCFLYIKTVGKIQDNIRLITYTNLKSIFKLLNVINLSKKQFGQTNKNI